MLFPYLNFIFDSGSGSLFSGSSFSVQPAFGRARTLDGSLTNLSKPHAWKPLGEFSNPELGDNFEIVRVVIWKEECAPNYVSVSSTAWLLHRQPNQLEL